MSSMRAVGGSTAKRNTAAPDRGKLITLVVGKRLRLLFTGDDDEVFVTRSLNVTRRQQNSMVNLKPK